MEHAVQEISFHHEPGGKEVVSKIIRTTVILSVITIIELGMGLGMYAIPMAAGLKLFLKGVIVILSLAKAFYIVGVFMHLGEEVKNLIMTIVVPLLLFIWFIAAFLYEGNSWKNLRNTYNPKQAVSAPAAPHEAGEHH
ncbi:MAG: cytochrome C oxidase subunit IV family protein [bacterium]|jgi:cytochrome c oxidase subunit 4|nr:cytochrome C oxidase subunit IV family protein [Chitinophagaceae bacterium]